MQVHVSFVFIMLFHCGSQALAAVNLAVVAKPSTSHVSGDTSLVALADEQEPRNSRDRHPGSYGNWPRQGTQWVQYHWSLPIHTHGIDVYWWDDNRGVRLPAAARLMYWDGQIFKPVQSEQSLGVAGDQYNPLRFTPVITTQLRLEIDGNEQYSTGVLEWKVYDTGQSPPFAPQVTAGVDRSVVRNGCTYLEAQIKTLNKPDSPPPSCRWSKLSGPGWVTFADFEDLQTTAVFSETGTYVLQCRAETEGLSQTDTLQVRVIAGPPEQHLRPIDTTVYTIDSPLWSQRAKAIIVNWIPHCINKINDPNLPQGGINNLIDAARKLQGKPAGKHRGYVFSNAWIYNTIESICIALMVNPQGDGEIGEAQKFMRATLDDWIPKVLAAQEPDGYIQTAYTLSDRQRFSPRYRADHEGYVAGYFLEAAVSHYQLTDGKDLRLYHAAKRLADCWENQIGPPPKQNWFDGHQAMEMALVRFGRFVNTVEGQKRGQKYIQLGKFLLDCRRDGSEYDQSHVPVIRQYEAVGHAVRASYNYAGMSDVAMETHDVDYQSAVASLFDNMIHRKYYVTGGIGSGETSEGFGPDYSLRHNAYCESCSSCGLIMFEHKLNMAYHDARYADLYEETLYNALLGSLDLEGKNFYYQNPLEAYGERYDWHGCPCCVGNIPRVLLMLPTWMYVKDDRSIYVNLFVGSTVTVPDIAGTNVELIQETNYPWGGTVRITVNPQAPKAFGLHIRVPNREVSELYQNSPAANGIQNIEINGKIIQPRVEKGYAYVSRTWKRGDVVELALPMVVQRVKGIDRIEATRGQVALRYGPLIYCVEAADQILGKSLPPDSDLDAEWQPDLLQGIVTVKGVWADGSALQAVPYYVRNNRLKQQDGEENKKADSAATEGDRRRRRNVLGSTVWLKE